MERLAKQLRFLQEIDQLKGVLRQTALLDRSRRENSAEHSWHLAMMAVTLCEYTPPGTDVRRVITMVLLAADRIFSLLPADQALLLRAVWDEFEERRTPEARFARALDRLQPMLANYYNGGGTWLSHGVTADQVLAKVRLIEEGSAELGAYARQLIAAAVGRGILAPAR